jgi:hypothetical protein
MSDYVETCERKRSYRTEHSAIDAMREFAKRHGHQPSRAYHCHVCHQWHLTSQPSRSTAVIQKR